jgi:hypothetical protein
MELGRWSEKVSSAAAFRVCTRQNVQLYCPGVFFFPFPWVFKLQNGVYVSVDDGYLKRLCLSSGNVISGPPSAGLATHEKSLAKLMDRKKLVFAGVAYSIAHHC